MTDASLAFGLGITLGVTFSLFVLWPALLFWALTYFLPDRAIATLVQQIARREPLFTNVAKTWLALFTATGLVRLVAFALGVESPFVH